MEDDKAKIDKDVLKYYELQSDATKVVMKMLFFLNYGGVVATITALVSSSFRNNKNIFIACLFIFIFGLISAISMVLAVRQFAFGVFTKSVTFRSNCSNYDDFKNKIENEMTNSPWKSIIRICSGFSLILFMVGIIIGLIALFI